MHVALYWLVRTALFLAVYALLWWLRWFDIWAVVLALFIGWVLSYVAFPGLRSRASQQMDGWIRRSETGVVADADAEDAETDAPGRASS